MRWIFALFIALFLTSCRTPPDRQASAPTGVSPVPEAQQAPLALQILDGYHGTNQAAPPQKLYLVYFTSADRDPVPRYQQRLEAIMEDVRAFYRDGMARNGFGPKTFTLERDPAGQLIIHVVKGKRTKADYARTWKDHYRIILGECQPTFHAAGISLKTNTVAIFCNLADWNPKTRVFTHPTPYSGIWWREGGLCWLMDSPILDIDYLHQKSPVVKDFQFHNVPIGKRNAMFIGGIAHEAGHALGLPHSGERWDEKPLGKSIMGTGSLTYNDDLNDQGKGAFLNFASALRLAGRPLFNNSSKGRAQPARLDQCSLTLSTNITSPRLAGRRGAIRIEGTAQGSPPIYGIIAYFESVHDGGYHSPTATAVPDAQGRFALEVSDLEPCTNSVVRIAFCHVNGGVSERQHPFAVTPDGRVDISSQ